MGAISSLKGPEPDPKDLTPSESEQSAASEESSPSTPLNDQTKSGEATAETVPSETLSPPDADPKVSVPTQTSVPLASEDAGTPSDSSDQPLVSNDSPKETVADATLKKTEAPATTRPSIIPLERQDSQPTVASPTISVTTPVATQPQSDYDLVTQALLGKIGAPGVGGNFKICIFSEPGNFKSSWLRTAPGNLILDLEDGAIAMHTAAKKTGIPVAPGVRSINLTSWNGAEQLLDRIERNLPGFSKEEYPVFSIDTYSELHKKGIAEIKDAQYALRPSTNRFKVEADEHGENNERLARFARRLRDLDRDIILTSHARTVEPKNKPSKTYLDFSESLSNKIEAMMDIVAYVTAVEKDDGTFDYVFRVMPGAGIHAKTRYDLPAEILNPTWPQLKEVYLQAKAEAKAAEEAERASSYRG